MPGTSVPKVGKEAKVSAEKVPKVEKVPKEKEKVASLKALAKAKEDSAKAERVKVVKAKESAIPRTLRKGLDVKTLVAKVTTVM